MSQDWDGEIVNNLLVGSPAGGHIVISSQIPSELIAHYSFLQTLTSAYIGEYTSDGAYRYEIWGTDTPGTYYHATGWVLPDHTVNETSYDRGLTGFNGTDIAFGENSYVHRIGFGGGGNQGEQFLVKDWTVQIDGDDSVPDRFDIRVNGISLGRGITASDTQTATSVAVAAGTESVIETLTNVPLAPNRAYRVTYGDRVESSVADGAPRFHLRETNATGTVLIDYGTVPCIAAGQDHAAFSSGYICNTTNATLIRTLVLCLQNLTATGTVDMPATATHPRWLAIEDVGAASDWPMAFPVP